MGFWRKKQDEFEETAELINEEPGLLPGEVARKLGVSPSTITRRLPAMEEAGILLSEDERGGLWPFGRRK
ncbi:MAG: winged helix-turn-helix domain-containing protein [Caldilineaceae bacterium]|nr:winged helix-turn-helix domain-containing protein [Caldilineaceae bacterium]MCB9139424.1 winged helix-turn-helix domain-containing protein [Caldilineaceae bacterium]